MVLLIMLAPAIWAQSATLRELADQALEAKEYDRAIDLFGKAATADPTDYYYEFQLALTFSQLGRDADAIPHYRATLERKPGLYEAQLNLGLSLARSDNPAAAIPLFQAAAEQKPGEFRPVFSLGQALFSTAKYGEAEAAFRTAVGLDARSAAAESGWAMALARQNHADDAAPHFQQAFTLDRTYRSGFVALAQLYEANQRTAEAITFYRMFPDNPIALERLGVLLTKNGEMPEALAALELAVEKNPTPERRIALAQAYVKTKQIAKAEAAVAPAVAALPDDVELRMFYGRLLRDQRKFPQAAREFGLVTQTKPDVLEAWNELAGVLMIGEQYPQALTAFDRLRALGAESVANLFYRALANDRLVQRVEAVENYKKFLAASPGKFPDQEFQARQRVRTLENELKKR